MSPSCMTVSAGLYWTFRPHPAGGFYSRLSWFGQCRGGHFVVGFPRKRKTATNKGVNFFD